jgi:hydroxymethylbilane synthase
MVPAPGQGALAVECRDAEPALAAMLDCVNDPASRAAVTAERTVLAELQAGCSAPVGAYAAGTEILHLTAVVIGDDGPALRASASGPIAEAARLGHAVAADLLRRGAMTATAAAARFMSNGDDEQ